MPLKKEKDSTGVGYPIFLNKITRAPAESLFYGSSREGRIYNNLPQKAQKPEKPEAGKAESRQAECLKDQKLQKAEIHERPKILKVENIHKLIFTLANTVCWVQFTQAGFQHSKYRVKFLGLVFFFLHCTVLTTFQIPL